MYSMIYFNPLRNEADFLFGKTKKKIKNLKNLLTFENECDKVNELLISNGSQKNYLKSFEKT